MNIFGRWDAIASVFERLKFTTEKAAHIATRVYGHKDDDKNASFLTRVGRYIANSRPATFLTSPNFSHMCTLFIGLTAFGAVSAVAQGAPFPMIVTALWVGVGMNGRNLYKHKQKLQTHAVLDDMLKTTVQNQKQIAALPLSMQRTLNSIFPEGTCKQLGNPKFAPKPKEPSSWQIAALRGVFSPSILVVAAAAMLSFRPDSIACSALGFVFTHLGGTLDEKERHERKTLFENSVDSAKQQLGCFNIDTTVQTYKRIAAEQATIKAITQGKSEYECREIYNRTLTETVPAIRKAGIKDNFKGIMSGIGTTLYHGFSSKASAALYTIPDSIGNKGRTIAEAEAVSPALPSRDKPIHKPINPKKSTKSILAQHREFKRRGKQQEPDDYLNNIGL